MKKFLTLFTFFMALLVVVACSSDELYDLNIQDVKHNTEVVEYDDGLPDCGSSCNNDDKTGSGLGGN